MTDKMFMEVQDVTEMVNENKITVYKKRRLEI